MTLSSADAVVNTNDVKQPPKSVTTEPPTATRHNERAHIRAHIPYTHRDIHSHVQPQPRAQPQAHTCPHASIRAVVPVLSCAFTSTRALPANNALAASVIPVRPATMRAVELDSVLHSDNGSSDNAYDSPPHPPPPAQSGGVAATGAKAVDTCSDMSATPCVVDVRAGAHERGNTAGVTTTTGVQDRAPAVLGRVVHWRHTRRCNNVTHVHTRC